MRRARLTMMPKLRLKRRRTRLVCHLLYYLIMLSASYSQDDAATRAQCEDPDYLIASWDAPAALFLASYGPAAIKIRSSELVPPDDDEVILAAAAAEQQRQQAADEEEEAEA